MMAKSANPNWQERQCLPNLNTCLPSGRTTVGAPAGSAGPCGQAVVKGVESAGGRVGAKVVPRVQELSGFWNGLAPATTTVREMS